MGTEAETAPTHLVWSNEHRAWWRPNRCGYTIHVEAAGRYSRSEAIDICAHARDGFKDKSTPSEIPVAWDDVIDCLIARVHVDRAASSRMMGDGE